MSEKTFMFLNPLDNDTQIFDLVIISETTFLNRDLDEEIYMEDPEGFSALGKEKKVCKLVKSLYRQAPNKLHEKLDSVMMSNRFEINEYDKYVYVKDSENRYVILCLYVDDILIMGNDDNMIKITKKLLNSKFDMKDMGLVDVILDIKSQESLIVSL